VIRADEDCKVYNEIGKCVHSECALSGSSKGAHFCEIYKNGVIKGFNLIKYLLL